MSEEQLEQKEEVTKEEITEEKKKQQPLLGISAFMYPDGSWGSQIDDPSEIAKGKPYLLIGLAEQLANTIREITSPVQSIALAKIKNILDEHSTTLTTLTETLNNLLAGTRLATGPANKTE